MNNLTSRCIALLGTILLSVEAHAFTALCTPGSPPSGQTGPSSNLLHISVWNSVEGDIYSAANHDTLWFQGAIPIAEYESGDFDPVGAGSFVSWIATFPFDPIFLTNLDESKMRFYTSGGGFIPPGWLNFSDDCEGSGVVF